MDKSERDNLIEQYGSGHAELQRALADVPRAAWTFKPAPEEWSVHEIIIHLADSEAMAALRLRKMIVEPGKTLMPYDQALWARELNYAGQNTDDALEMLRLVRKSTYELLRMTNPSRLDGVLVHPESDKPYTFERWLRAYSNHVPAHIEQIRGNMQAWQARSR